MGCPATSAPAVRALRFNSLTNSERSFLCHSELSCVIPSAAEGPRIFLNAGRPTSPTDQAISSTLSSSRSFSLCHSERSWMTRLPPAEALSAAEGEESRILLPLAFLVVILEPPRRRIPDPSSPLPVRARPTRVPARIDPSLWKIGDGYLHTEIDYGYC